MPQYQLTWKFSASDEIKARAIAGALQRVADHSSATRNEITLTEVLAHHEEEG